MKNIILSTDGTGNSGGKNFGTNVWRLHTAIDRSNLEGCKQVSFYHDGVGTQDNKAIKVLSGAFGWGLKRTIVELYVFLVNNYSNGDRIYLFGFSRGAYTVRLLAGMITSCGILNRKAFHGKSDIDVYKEVESVYKAYKNILKLKKCYDLDSSDLVEEIETLKSKLNKNRYCDAVIKFIGVWDTVDAYAIPSDRFAKIVDKVFYTSFREHDNSLSDKVEYACHALSIDDKRRTFLPVLWRENSSKDAERIKQVWFSGVHSNVGGGYPKQGLAWISLEWMMLEAKLAGLRFTAEDVEQFTENKNAHDKIYDSRSGLGAYYSFKERDIGHLWKKYVSDESVPKIHESVFERIKSRTELYSPNNIPSDFDVFCTRQEKLENDCNFHKDDLLRAISEERKGLSRSSSVFYCVANLMHNYFSLFVSSVFFLLFCFYEFSLLLSGFITILVVLVVSQISNYYKRLKLIKWSTFWRGVFRG